MFIEIKGKGHVNVDNVVMINKSIEKNKYVVILTHGGKITVSKTVRDNIIKGYDWKKANPRLMRDDYEMNIIPKDSLKMNVSDKFVIEHNSEKEQKIKEPKDDELND
jgi:hypothetical protein